MFGLLNSLPVLMEDTVPANISNFFTITGALIQQILTWLTQMTTWVMGDSLASLFFGIMILMLAIHVLHSLIKFS